VSTTDTKIQELLRLAREWVRICVEGQPHQARESARTALESALRSALQREPLKHAELLRLRGLCVGRVSGELYEIEFARAIERAHGIDSKDTHG
jgi:hypothetical protein